MSLPGLRQFKNATVGEEIGHGSYGTVYNITLDDECSVKEAAGKELYSELSVSDVWVNKFYEECNTFAKLQHRNIVQMYGLFVGPNAKIPMLIMEKMHTNLHAWLMNKVEGLRPMTIGDKFQVMREVVEGLAYIHDNKHVHRDLTAKNILISNHQHESGVLAKIADFGTAKIMEESNLEDTHTACPGTHCYMPPEATVRHPKYDFSLDVYSFGVLLVFMLTGNLPVEPAIPRQSLKKIQDHQEVDVSKLLLLVERCLAIQPKFRPTCEVIKHTLNGNWGAIEGYSWECGNGYTPGLNIKGVCREKECITHERDVVCDIRFDHFDLATHAPDIKCPNCGSHVDPDTLIFYQCEWKVKGKWWESFSKPAENYDDEGEVGVNETVKQFPIAREGGKWLKLTIDVVKADN